MKKLTTTLFLITILFAVIFSTTGVEAQIEPPDRSIVITPTPTQRSILRPQETQESQPERENKHKPTPTKKKPTKVPTETAVPTIFISPSTPIYTPSFYLPNTDDKTKEEIREGRPHIL